MLFRSGYHFKLFATEYRITDDEIPWLTKQLYTMKRKWVCVYETYMKPNYVGFGLAMILGEKHLLEEEQKNLYQEMGIGHILAISGLHISLLCLLVVQLLQRIGLHIYYASFVAMFLLLAYGVITGFSLSTSRAVIMMCIYLGARIVGRMYDLPTALSVSAVWILFLQPQAWRQSGFQLSFIAVLAIHLLYQPLNQRIQLKSILLSKILSLLLASASIQIYTIPILLYHNFSFSLYSIFLNIIILSFMSLLFSLLLLGGLLGLLLPSAFAWITRMLLSLSEYILNLYEWLAKLCYQLPCSIQIWGRPSLHKIILYYSVPLFLYFYIYTTGGLENINSISVYMS